MAPTHRWEGIVSGPGIDPDEFKDVMSAVAATVTVVTAYMDEVPIGITVSAFTSVSVEPPIVLVCIDKVAGALQGYLAAEGFTVNFLPEDASDAAAVFATKDIDRFAGVSWSAPSVPEAGPVLDLAYGSFQCATVRQVDMGDHWVIFGRVDAGGRRDRVTSPLLYVNRDFARTRPL